MGEQGEPLSGPLSWHIDWRSPRLPPRGDLDEFMHGPDAEFDGTLRGAWRLWRELGRASDRMDDWEAQSTIAPAQGRIEDIRAASARLFDVADSYGFDIVEEWPRSDTAIAEIDFHQQLIVLAPGYSEEVNLASLAHEMGHFMDPWLQNNWEWSDNYRHEGDIEIVAQMASAVFADWYGVDMMASTRGYLSYWARSSTARRDRRVGELLERASISGLTLLPQTDEVAYELGRARERLRYRQATDGLLGRFAKSEEREAELGLVDCSDW